MSRRRYAGLVLLALAFGLLAGCRFDGQAQRVEGYLFTIYTMPRILRPGPLQIGLRVQDPDYLIQTSLEAQLTWTEPGTGAAHTVSMLPGPGRDFRARCVLPQPGTYRIRATVRLPSGRVLAADYSFRVPES